MSDDALELLQQENVSLTALFDELEASTGQSVIDRASHGAQIKRLLRRLALREAAKADIAHALEAEPELDAVRQKVLGCVKDRRSAINDLGLMTRHIQGIDLNSTQDVDAVVWRARDIVLPEILWELSEGVPTLRRSLSGAQQASMRSARYLRKHAPTKLNPKGPQWYERARVVSWFVTAWDRLSDRPRPSRGAQVES